MRLRLRITQPDKPAVEVYTNLLCITEWERVENRKMSDGRGIGLGDMACWAFNMLKQSGKPPKEETWREWVANNPETQIEGVDMTDPNPTEAAPTAAS